MLKILNLLNNISKNLRQAQTDITFENAFIFERHIELVEVLYLVKKKSRTFFRNLCINILNQAIRHGNFRYENLVYFRPLHYIIKNF